MVAAAIRTVFAQPDAARCREQFDTIAVILGRQLPEVEAMMREAKDDLLAFSAFPQVHWRQLWSTNPLERTNKEIKRRTDVVGVFPNPAALLRLAGASWSNNTTNGPPPTAATSANAPWPCSSQTPTTKGRWPHPNS